MTNLLESDWHQEAVRNARDVRARAPRMRKGDYISRSPRGGMPVVVHTTRNDGEVVATGDGRVARLDRWCQCENKHPLVYFEYILGGQHGWVCESCRGLQQVG